MKATVLPSAFLALIIAGTTATIGCSSFSSHSSDYVGPGGLSQDVSNLPDPNVQPKKEENPLAQYGYGQRVQESPERLLMQADAYFTQKRYYDATRLYKKYLSKPEATSAPTDLLALMHYRIGFVECKKMFFSNAASEYRQATQLAPQNDDYLFAYAKASYEAKDFQTADQQFIILLNRNPNYPEGQYYYGLTLLESSNRTNALQPLTIAVGELQAHALLTDKYYAKGELDQALQAEGQTLQVAIRLGRAVPDFPHKKKFEKNAGIISGNEIHTNEPAQTFSQTQAIQTYNNTSANLLGQPSVICQGTSESNVPLYVPGTESSVATNYNPPAFDKTQSNSTIPTTENPTTVSSNAVENSLDVGIPITENPLVPSIASQQNQPSTVVTPTENSTFSQSFIPSTQPQLGVNKSFSGITSDPLPSSEPDVQTPVFAPGSIVSSTTNCPGNSVTSTVTTTNELTSEGQGASATNQDQQEFELSASARLLQTLKNNEDNASLSGNRKPITTSSPMKSNTPPTFNVLPTIGTNNTLVTNTVQAEPTYQSSEQNQVFLTASTYSSAGIPGLSNMPNQEAPLPEGQSQLVQQQIVHQQFPNNNVYIPTTQQTPTESDEAFAFATSGVSTSYSGTIQGSTSSLAYVAATPTGQISQRTSIPSQPPHPQVVSPQGMVPQTCGQTFIPSVTSSSTLPGDSLFKID